MSKKNKWPHFNEAHTNNDENMQNVANDANTSQNQNQTKSETKAETETTNNTNTDTQTQANQTTQNTCEQHEDTIANLKSQVEEWQNKYLRAYADAENSKRRAEIDAKNLVDYRISNFAKDMIPLADNLSLALAAMDGKVDENTITGLKAIQDNFLKALEKNGITKIATVGVKLNPLEHRVVTQIASDAPVDTIVQELQAGYKIGDKVIREAMVATSKPKE